MWRPIADSPTCHFVDISDFYSIVVESSGARPIRMSGVRDLDAQDRELRDVYGIDGIDGIDPWAPALLEDNDE